MPTGLSKCKPRASPESPSVVGLPIRSQPESTGGPLALSLPHASFEPRRIDAAFADHEARELRVRSPGDSEPADTCASGRWRSARLSVPRPRGSASPVRRTGRMGVPVIEIDGRPILGSDRPEIDCLLGFAH